MPALPHRLFALRGSLVAASVAVSAAGLLAGCGSGGGSSTAGVDERLQAGRASFDTHCLACHADATGRQVPTTGTSLVNARNQPEAIARAIASNVGGMGRLSTLSAEELANIALFLGQAVAAPGSPPAAGPVPAPAPGEPPGPSASNDRVNTQARAVQVASGLANPWGGAVLPDGRLLVTQRSVGRLALVNLASGQVEAELDPGLSWSAPGQGGMLGLALDPAFASNQRIYWTYTEPGSGGDGTAVARARLVGNALQDVRVIFRQTPKVSRNVHYGSRLVFGGDGSLFVTLGERGQDNPDAPTRDFTQNTANTIGKVVRITTDGAPAAGNPGFGAGAAAGLWSLGHRNPQGAALHPVTGELWVSEHGPQGGDEINIARAGQNYGWPFRNWGCNYGGDTGSGCRIGGGQHAPTYTEPLTTWVPQSVAPAGMAFTPPGNRYPGWENSLFMGAMSGIPNGGQSLWRLSVTNNAVTAREYMLRSINERIRDVVPSPDGWLYLLTDSGRVLRLQQN
jgi:aldose sugar dehydrogenase